MFGKISESGESNNIIDIGNIGETEQIGRQNFIISELVIESDSYDCLQFLLTNNDDDFVNVTEVW